jgi:hypothetical protein
VADRGQKEQRRLGQMVMEGAFYRCTHRGKAVGRDSASRSAWWLAHGRTRARYAGMPAAGVRQRRHANDISVVCHKALGLARLAWCGSGGRCTTCTRT